MQMEIAGHSNTRILVHSKKGISRSHSVPVSKGISLMVTLQILNNVWS